MEGYWGGGFGADLGAHHLECRRLWQIAWSAGLDVVWVRMGAGARVGADEWMQVRARGIRGAVRRGRRWSRPPIASKGRMGAGKRGNPREVECPKCNSLCELRHTGNDFATIRVEPGRKLKRTRLN